MCDMMRRRTRNTQNDRRFMCSLSPLPHTKLLYTTICNNLNRSHYSHLNYQRFRMEVYILRVLLRNTCQFAAVHDLYFRFYYLSETFLVVSHIPSNRLCAILASTYCRPSSAGPPDFSFEPFFIVSETSFDVPEIIDSHMFGSIQVKSVVQMSIKTLTYLDMSVRLILT
jgi:hypothetical protein